jgi:hypothetical protein
MEDARRQSSLPGGCLGWPPGNPPYPEGAWDGRQAILPTRRVFVSVWRPSLLKCFRHKPGFVDDAGAVAGGANYQQTLVHGHVGCIGILL